MESNFEWDEDKAKANVEKHKISFEEAATVLSDPFSVTIYDPDHSADETRFIDLGMSNKERLLVVVYTERQDKIRIISCRRATRTERSKYEESSK